MSDSLQPHGLQHARTHCPSPTPGVYSNSCPLSQWCYPTISSSLDPLLPPSIFPSIRVFSNESDLLIRWPKYWSFSFSPSNEYSGLISFRIDWFGLLAVQFSSVQSLSRVQLFATPWIAACQASLSITISRSSSKLMCIESMRQFNHLALCWPLLLLPTIFPEGSGSFPMSQLFASGGQSIGVSASTSVLPMNIQDWFPLGLMGLTSLQSKGL